MYKNDVCTDLCWLVFVRVKRKNSLINLFLELIGARVEGDDVCISTFTSYDSNLTQIEWRDCNKKVRRRRKEIAWHDEHLPVRLVLRGEGGVKVVKYIDIVIIRVVKTFVRHVDFVSEWTSYSMQSIALKRRQLFPSVLSKMVSLKMVSIYANGKLIFEIGETEELWWWWDTVSLWSLDCETSLWAINFEDPIFVKSGLK